MFCTCESVFSEIEFKIFIFTIEKIQGVIPSRVKKYASYPRSEMKFISENRVVIGFVVYEISNHYLGPVLPCDHYRTGSKEHHRQTYRQTDRQTDGQTDGRNASVVKQPLKGC